MTNPYRKKSIPTHKSETFAIKIMQLGDILTARIEAENYYRHFLKTYGKIGQEGTIKITLKKPLRSQLQNNFYWAYLTLISLSCGHSPKELHKWASGKFLSKGITEIFGDKVRKVGSTTELTRNEFGEYMARIELATEIPIPDPEKFNIGLTHDEYRRVKEQQRRIYTELTAKNIDANSITARKGV